MALRAALVVQAILAALPSVAAANYVKVPGAGSAGSDGYTPPSIAFQNDQSALNSDFTVGMNYMLFVGHPDMVALGETSDLGQVDYQRLVDSGVKQVSTWYGTDWSCTNYPSGCNQWTQAKHQAFEQAVARMQSYGVNVSVKIGWTYTYDICKPPTTACTPTASDLTAFSHFASDLLDRLINARGFTNLTAIQLFTEPNFGHNSPNPPNDLKAYYVMASQSVVSQISVDDATRMAILPRIRVVGPNSEQQSADDWLTYVKTNADASFGGYSQHEYCLEPTFGPLGIVASDCKSWSALTTTLAGWKADAGTKNMWLDEGGFLGVVSNGGLDEYRQTTDLGVLTVRRLDSAARSGIKASLPWMAQDQCFPHSAAGGSPAYTDCQWYGILGRWPGQSLDVPPTWSAMALYGRLVGRGATVYPAAGNTATLHPTGYVTASGDYTFVVINEGSAALSVHWGFDVPLSTPRTFYRYVFDAGSPSLPRPNKPAWVPEWDSAYVNVSRDVSASIVPAHSAVFWSTLSIASPYSQSSSRLASSATATATTSGDPQNLVDGNATHVDDATTTWKAGGTGSQSATMTWPSAIIVNRIEVDMEGSMPPLWWADYATGATPAPPDQYSIQWWDGATWRNTTPAISVTSNTQLKRTHTFQSVSTTSLRLVVPNAPSAPFTEIETYYDAPYPDTAIGLWAYTASTGAAGQITYHKIADTSYTIQAGDVVEYDVTLLDKTDYTLTAKPGTGGIDVTIDAGCSSTELRSVGWTDQNGVSGDPASDLTPYAYATWFHRQLRIPSCAVGHVAQAVAIAQIRTDRVNGADGTTHFGGQATAFYDNIQIKHSDGTVALDVYTNGAPQTVVSVHASGMQASNVFVTRKQ